MAAFSSLENPASVLFAIYALIVFSFHTNKSP
jgi:hypothetical protein